MEKITFTRRLRGRMTVTRPGVIDAELESRGARVAARLVFSDEVAFEQAGTLDFGGGHAVRFRSVESGRLERSADGLARHGTSVLGIVDGTGRYARASGRITSNFVLSPDGEVTDEQVVVLFIEGKGK